MTPVLAESFRATLPIKPQINDVLSSGRAINIRAARSTIACLSM
nr:MAG TPA: hypothetical protein [Caudoviricetes sp.]